MSQDTYQLLDLIIAFLSVLTTAIIAWVLFDAGKKSEKQNYSNELKNLWTQIDSTVLSNDLLLFEADKMIHPNKIGDSIEVKRRRWICYMLQNAIAITQTGITKKLIPDEQNVQKSLDKTLSTLAKNPEYKEVSEYCHEKELKEKCDAIV